LDVGFLHLEKQNMSEDLALQDQGLDDDFNAGFLNEAEPTPTPVTETQDEPVSKTAPEPQATKYAQITEDQYQDLLSKASQVEQTKAEHKRLLDTAFGQLGGLKQRIEQMQNATPAGEPIVVTNEDFAEVLADFPEFGEAQIKGLNRALSKIKGTGSAGLDSSVIHDMVEQRVANQAEVIRKEIIDSTLEASYPDWKEDIRSAKFKSWFDAQTPEVQRLAESNSVGQASRMLRMYESAKNTPTPVSKPSTRQKQIEAAVTPRGVGGHAAGPSEDDDFMAGFNNT
jgi:hypothetical protein